MAHKWSFSTVFLLFSLSAFLFLHPFLACAKAEETGKARQRLVLLNWSAQYMDQELVKEFEEKFNAQVVGVYFETGEERNELFVNTNGEGYDLALIEQHRLPTYIKQNWISQINPSEIPNLKHIPKKWMFPDDEGRVYSVPYAWGTMGIAYRKDLVPEPITSWKQLFNPGKELQSKILMMKDSVDSLGAALMALGYSQNSADPKELAEAESLLMKQRPFVKTYSTFTVNENSELISGELVAGMAWNGDAVILQKFNPNIEYVIPVEGSTIWVDTLAIVEKSKNKKLAADFLNFINEPKNAARICKTVKYATPNAAAIKHVPKEILENPVIYPSEKAVSHSEYNKTLPPKAAKTRNAIFSRVLLN